MATIMAQDMSADCRRPHSIMWQEASRASVRKLQAAKACVGGDSRARGLLLFHGATSGRWSGQLWQPQNLPRGSGIVTNQDHAIELIRYRDADMLRLVPTTRRSRWFPTASEASCVRRRARR